MMNTKIMRMILFFDLPAETVSDKKAYAIFHKELIKHGWIMLQFSVYCKIINFQTKMVSEIQKLQGAIPKYGNIRILNVTEHQYQNIKIILGEKSLNEDINSAKRYVII
ncbi:MAG: CRISPR-associated endonuclease Cas2 [Mycoplasmataceae bacterium]|nr:CRISPR-associated endonuclease Cas2 [Mycoplasmataceae bacterium]